MKKGFTLVELLAVIVILAILALIAVPIVTNIIDKAEKDSELMSAKMYISGVEKSILTYNISNKLKDATCEVQSDGNLDCDGTTIQVDVQNTKATGGTITIENRKVSKVQNLKIGDNTYKMNTKGKIIKTDDELLYVYSAQNITDISQGSTSSLIEEKMYYRYDLTDGELVQGTVPAVCMYSESLKKELCLKDEEYEASVQKIRDFFEYDENTWVKTVNENNGLEYWNDPTNSYSCVENNYYSCFETLDSNAENNPQHVFRLVAKADLNGKKTIQKYTYVGQDAIKDSIFTQ